jgi:hypothetical protein
MLIQMNDHLSHGLPPVAGGALDQCKAAMDGFAAVRAELAYWKAERSRKR